MNVNVEDDSFINKLVLNGQTVYLKILWKDNETDLFQLKVYDGDRTWSGRFSTELGEQYRNRFDESKLEYSNYVKLCLSGESDDFTYGLNTNAENPDTSTFVWKKKFSTATIIHGTVSLVLDTIPESKDNLIDFLMAKNKSLHHAAVDMNKNISNLTEELEIYKKEMEKCIDIKDSLESVLYGKFVQVLNTKKRRIQLLEENIKKFTERKDV